VPDAGGVGVVGVVVCDVLDPVVGAVLVPVAADAPAMPAAAPPVASAPATIVAPSIFEMRMGETSWGCGMDAMCCIHRARGR